MTSPQNHPRPSSGNKTGRQNVIQQKEEGGSSCDDRPLLSFCLICPLHHSATLHSYCAQECGQDRHDKSDYLRPSILVFHGFFTFLHFYIFTFHRRFSFVFYHGFFFNPDYVFVFTTDFTDLTDFSLTQITFLFLPRISRISRIFLSTARIANPTERQYPLNSCHPCSFRFRFYFYHGFHRFHGFYSAPHPCLSVLSVVFCFHHGFHRSHGFFSASSVSSILI